MEIWAFLQYGLSLDVTCRIVLVTVLSRVDQFINREQTHPPNYVKGSLEAILSMRHRNPRRTPSCKQRLRNPA